MNIHTKRIRFFSGALFLFTVVSYLGAQDVPQGDEPVQKEPVQREEAPVKPAQQKKPAQKQVQSDKKQEQGGAPADTLLSITDGNFKYSRIPGITLPKQPVAAADDIVRIPDESVNEQRTAPAEPRDGEPKSGFAGMSRETVNNIVKVLILLLIAAIFILYRVNSGRRNRRRFFK
jgi:hypothetical protein